MPISHGWIAGVVDLSTFLHPSIVIIIIIIINIINNGHFIIVFITFILKITSTLFPRPYATSLRGRASYFIFGICG